MVLAVELFKACCGSVAKIATFASLDPMAGPPSKNVVEYLTRHNVSVDDLRLLYREAMQRGPYMLELALQESEGLERLLAPFATECHEDILSIRERVVLVCQKLRSQDVLDEIVMSLDSGHIQNAIQEMGTAKEVFVLPDTLVFYFNKISGYSPEDVAFQFLVHKKFLFECIDYQYRTIFLNENRLKILASFSSWTKMKLRLNLLAKQITTKDKQKAQAGNPKELQTISDEIALYQSAFKKMSSYFEEQKSNLENLQNVMDILEQQIGPDVLEKVKELPVQQAKVKKDSMETSEVNDTVDEVARLTKQAMEFLGADRIEFSHSLLGPILENQRPKIEKAKALFEKIPNSHPQKTLFANRLGVILNALGVPDKASEYFRRALVLLPNSNRQERGPIESNLFHALLNRGNFDAALRYMLEALEVGSEECNLFDIERYIPKQILGVGGMGVTFLCEDAYAERMVVVKTLWRYATGGLKETFSEAFTKKKMDDPHIIKIYDIGRHHANRPFLVMEFCPGIDLQRYIQECSQNKPLEITEALAIIVEVAKGLAVAHSQNPPIIHRDIKPNNILYSPDTKAVKIIDFGIACMLPNPEEISRSISRTSGSVIAKNIAGTWGYMSPEQQRGEPNLTARSDVFSLGKTLMFLLTGKTPPPENIFALNPQVREYVGELVGYCLMPHAEERYTAEQIAQKIQEIQNRLKRAKITGPFASATVVEEPKTPHQAPTFLAPDMDTDATAMPALEASEVADEAFEAQAVADAEEVIPSSEPQEDSAANLDEAPEGLDVAEIKAMPSGPQGKAPQQLQTEDVEIEEVGDVSDEPNTESSGVETVEALFDSAAIELVNPDTEPKTTPPESTDKLFDSEENPSAASFEEFSLDNPEAGGNAEEFSLDNPEAPAEGGNAEEFSLDNSEASAEGGNAEEFSLDNSEAPAETGNAEEFSLDEEPMSQVSYDLPTEEEAPAAPEHSDILVKDQPSDEGGNHLKSPVAFIELELPEGYKKEGNIIICEKDGATMVYIPPGKFSMGFDGENGNFSEMPARDVYLDGYLIDECPVTWYQYNIFCEETNRAKPHDEVWELDESRPVVNITWEDAVAYAAWAKKTLPTEAQWEKAAKGGYYFDGDLGGMYMNSAPKRLYPWGDEEPGAGNVWFANYANEPRFGMRTPSPVGTYPDGSSPYGCLDMSGNIWEWCADWFSDGYYKTAPTTNPKGPKNGTGRTIRGGAWNCPPDKLTTTFRTWMEPDQWWNILGFRTTKVLVVKS